MKKFINHIDHVVWLSRLENAEKNVADLEAITGGNLVRYERDDMKTVLFIDWDAGLEVVAPMPEVIDFNRGLHERLESHGEPGRIRVCQATHTALKDAYAFDKLPAETIKGVGRVQSWMVAV